MSQSITTELQSPIWSVITDKTVLASNLSYTQARAVRERYAEELGGGVAVVTSAAARRLEEPNGTFRERIRL